MPRITTPDISTYDKYPAWLKTEHDVDVAAEESRYNLVALKIKSTMEASPFWAGLNACLQTCDERYQVAHGKYELVENYRVPELLVKKFDQFLLKTFRKNVLNNKNWPKGPLEGKWILPDNWYSKTNDIVRTCFLVRYFDGVRFLADCLKSAADGFEMTTHMEMQAKFDGYYAAHLYVVQLVDITNRDWTVDQVPIKVELQVTSHLQHMIRTMLHEHYESRRVMTNPAESRCEWDHTSAEFATTYLGHTLHYLEGMIVEVRDRKGDKRV